MSKPFRLRVLVVALLLAGLSANVAAAHNGLVLHDPFAHVTAQSGTVYVFIMNHADDDDALIGAASPQADMAMVMTSEDKDGVSSMQDAPPGGLPIAAYDTLVLAPGKAHIMLMGLKGKYRDGETIEVTLTFANSGSVTLTVPVMNKRSEAPQDVKSPYNGETGLHHGAATKGSMSMATIAGDEAAVLTVMKAQFDKPEAPLAVDPVVVMGDDAIASWVQGAMAGRALLRRGDDGQWTIQLFAGQELRDPAFLRAHGVTGAGMLSQMFNTAEDGLGTDKVSLFSTFEGVVPMSNPASK